MPQGVQCTVSNCEYWEKGNACVAEAILVNIDQKVHNINDAEFASEAMYEEQEQAATSSATCCQTFEQKKKENSGGK